MEMINNGLTVEVEDKIMQVIRAAVDFRLISIMDYKLKDENEEVFVFRIKRK